MKSFVTGLMLFALMILFVFPVSAQDRFDRVATLFPDDSLNSGGFGNVVAGVDFDADGFSEVYVVNNNWQDRIGLDMVPRIYKFEVDAAGTWNQVWSTRLEFDFQNTWPALRAADLDGDGKGEIVWGPVNNVSAINPNPPRIVVFETVGDGSDVMGIDNLDGTYSPNADTSIIVETQTEMRPFTWEIFDLDADGTDEIIAKVRRGSFSGFIISVDDVPDAGDGSETWTTEFTYGTSADYGDVVVMNSAAWFFDTDGNVVKVVSSAADTYAATDTMLALIPTGGVWKSVNVVDIDGDETEEILAANWFGDTKSVYLLEQSGDTLAVSATIASFDEFAEIRTLNGADVGDVDGDGNIDFIIGTRDFDAADLAQNHVVRVAYRGGLIDDPNSYETSIVDQNVAATQGSQLDAIVVANLDDDPEDEIVYCGETRPFASGGPPIIPVTILDGVDNNQPKIDLVLDVPNDQGRQVWVIWLAAEDDQVPDLLGMVADDKLPIAIFGPKDAEFPLTSYMGMELAPTRMGPGDVKVDQVGSITEYGVWRVDAGQFPVQLNTTSAVQFPVYAAVVPTLGDGEDYEGTFVVSAHTAEPYVNWKSFPRTGTSEDNLAPQAPTGLVGQETVAGQVDLSWDEPLDDDFNYFSIRRGLQADFVASAATEIATTTDVAYFDTDIEVGTTYYYRVVAFDFAGNEGALSDEVEVNTGTTGLEDEISSLPKSFAVHANYPNPFNPSTTIRFDLPKQTDVQVTIYNALGKKVRTLVNDSRSAGRYEVVWNGRNDNGAQVASGVYVYVVKAGQFVEFKKMTLMK